MDNELVSIIVPIYNTEAYLQKCIDSLVRQTYPGIEIILVNDGSTDRSLQICNENAKQYGNIRVISQKNKGVSAARNRGISESRGQYITFVDSDDELCPDAIEAMHGIITDREADVVSASMTGDENFQDAGAHICKIWTGRKTEELALREVSASACAKLFRKEPIHGILFEEGKKINEDGFFVFECYMRQLKIVETDKVVYLYRKRRNSASRTAFSEKFLDMFYFLEKKKAWVEAHCFQHKEKMLELEIRTNLNMLQLLCSTYDKRYEALEKSCCAFIRKQRGVDTRSFLRYEKRVYYAARLRIYSIYKLLIRILGK